MILSEIIANILINVGFEICGELHLETIFEIVTPRFDDSIVMVYEDMIKIDGKVVDLYQIDLKELLSEKFLVAGSSGVIIARKLISQYKLKASWSLEVVQDLKAVHNIDVDSMFLSQLNWK